MGCGVVIQPQYVSGLRMDLTWSCVDLKQYWHQAVRLIDIN